jgi:hypothetical protein
MRQKRHQRPPKNLLKPPKDPPIPSNVGAKALTKDQVMKEEMAAIQKAINHHTFCATIFLPAAGSTIWNRVMEKIYLSLNPHPSPESDDMNQWITTRGNVCGSAYNGTRTYMIGGQLKKSVYEYARTNGGYFPSLVKIQNIANHTIKLFLSPNEEADASIKAKVKENIDLFKWYWDVLLGRCCPSGAKL